ncbi:hypothetical protein KI387_032217 [Taxus chinensis]|uniref:NADP-dependent oxidoreductase domain-containing protein n=1 Tax=Taxus chinensis TaxID=29808 RepID=A0AA38F330_TAXCH|nr:hypothetical protein KI387_032217 [Taxus chinensis]
MVIVGTKKLGKQGLEVSAEGLGCMGMSFLYGPPKAEQDMIDLIHHAVEIGVTFLDISDIYEPENNEILVGKALKGIREKVQIATKFGLTWANEEYGVRGDPAYVRAACEASLKRLDIDCIDIYYQHRVDTTVPIEATMGELKKLVEEGKIKYVGLSEASASTICRAHAVHPVSAVQIEWSLWTRDAEALIIPTCRELGIGIVPYSPLGRGFFSSGAKLLESVSDKDFRKGSPRFQGENLESNEALFQKLSEISAKKGCSPSHVALAWVQHQGNDVVPIPGTTKIKNLDDNIHSLSVNLTAEDMNEIEAVFPVNAAAGPRYRAEHVQFSWMNSDTPPYSASH